MRADLFASAVREMAPSAIREILKLTADPAVISLAGGMPDPALFDVEGVRLATDAVLAEVPGAALQYGTTEGVQELRASLAAFSSRRALRVDPEQVVVTTGSTQGIDMALTTLVDPGDAVVLEQPTFLATIAAARLSGARVLAVDADADGIDVDALEGLLTRERPKLIYVIPTFANPTGAVLSLERRLALLRLAVEHEVVVVEDDPYGRLHFGPEAPPSLLELAEQVPGAAEWLVHLSSLSKVVAPGLRVGWMVAPPELLRRAVVVKQVADAHTSTFVQHVAHRYLVSGRLPARLDEIRATYEQRASALSALLGALPGEPFAHDTPTGGMFVWARVEDGVDVDALWRASLSAGVAFVPGAPFYVSEPDEQRVRLSFATVPVPRLEEAVARLDVAVRDARPA